jgi:hypothetical protein
MVIIMNLLNLSAQIVTAVKSNKAKQGVIADTIAKAFGYKSHHAVQGDIQLTTIQKPISNERTISLVKVMKNSYSVKDIFFDSDLTQTVGDTFFDYYMSISTIEAELLYQLTIHEALFNNMVIAIDAKRDPEIIDSDDLKALMPSSLPKEIVYALCIEIDESERPYMVYASFLEDIINMREAVSTFIINNSCNSCNS